MKNRLLLFILILCFGSCAVHRPAEVVLDELEAKLETAPDSAFVALDSLDRSILTNDCLRARHALLYSIALEKVGMDMTSDSIINIAVQYYNEHGDKDEKAKALYWQGRIHKNAELLPQKDTLQMQNEKMIKERYADKMTLVQNRRSSRMMAAGIFAICLISFLLILIIRYILRKLKSKPDDEAMRVITQRLALLDKFLASRLSSDYSFDKAAEEGLENLVADKDAFLENTRLAFKGSHPKFISYLEGKGLTAWETGFCCLYTLGLKGKDIGEYVQKKRHYIISSEIRSKLGLTEHDTNIGIYLRNLIADLETV